MSAITSYCDELINAISGNFNKGDSNTVTEIPDIENTGDGADPAATDPQPFNLDEFEIKFGEKFILDVRFAEFDPEGMTVWVSLCRSAVNLLWRLVIEIII